MMKRKRKADELVHLIIHIFIIIFDLDTWLLYTSVLSKSTLKISKRARELDTDMYPMDLAFGAKTVDD
jgi:hypothetical protein